jgi:hypothetical protein
LAQEIEREAVSLGCVAKRNGFVTGSDCFVLRHRRHDRRRDATRAMSFIQSPILAANQHMSKDHTCQGSKGLSRPDGQDKNFRSESLTMGVLDRGYFT